MLHGLTAGGIGRLVPRVAVRQVRRQRGPLRCLRLGLVIVTDLVSLALDLPTEPGPVGRQRLFQQALLLRRQGAGQALAGRDEL